MLLLRIIRINVEGSLINQYKGCGDGELGLNLSPAPYQTYESGHNEQCIVYCLAHIKCSIIISYYSFCYQHIFGAHLLWIDVISGTKCWL